MTTQYKTTCLIALLLIGLPGLALGALAGVNYNAVPTTTGKQAPSATTIAAASDGGSSGAGESSGGGSSSNAGTPSQKGNAASVRDILHPQPKDKKVDSVPEPMEIEDIETRIMDNSIFAYNGPCACPYSRNSDGFECGVEAAYYKPGGFRIYCYPEDVRGQLNIFYRKTH